MSEIKLKIVIDGKEAIATLNLTEKELADLKGGFGDAGKSSAGFTNQLNNSLENARNSIMGLKEVWSVFSGMFGGAVSAYQEAEIAEIQLTTAMKQRGHYTEAAMQDLQEYAANLQLTTTFEGDEAIALMGNLQAMGLSNQQTKEATKLGANLAALMGTDLASTSKLLADLFAGDATMINRYVKGLDEAVMKSGDMNAIMAMLNQVVGGQAEALAQASSGPLKQFQNSFGDLTEAVGGTISVAILPFVKGASTVMNALNSISPAITGVIGTIGMLTAAMVTLKITGLTGNITSILTYRVNLATLIPSLGANTAATGVATAAHIGFGAAVKSATLAIKGFFTSLGPIGWALLGITALVTAISLLGEETEETTKKLSDNEIQLRTEKNGYDRLATAVANTQLPMKERKEALVEINQKYPGYLEKVNLETMSQSELTAALDAGNQAYEKRIKIMVIEEQYRDKLKESIQLENTLRNAKFKTVEVKEFDAETGEEYIEYVKTYSAEVNAQKRNLANLKVEMEGMLNSINGLNNGLSPTPITPTTDGGTGGKKQGKSDIVGEKELIAIQKFEADKLKLRGATSLELLENERNNLEKLAQFYENYVTKDIELAKTIADKKIEIKRELQKSELQIENETAKVEAEIMSKANEEYGKIAQEQYDIRQAELEESRKIERLRLESIDNEYARQQALADYEYALNVEKYGDLESLKLEHDMKIAEIDKLKEEAITNNTISTLQTIGAAFGKHTLAYKMMASTQALISTWQMAQEAYKSAATIPLVGFILAPAAAAAAVATGLGNVAKINSTNVETGYAEGGLLPKGKAGFVEGWHNEIIAPEKTFIDVLNSSIIPRLTSPGPVVVNTGDANLSSKIEALFNKIDAWQTKLSVIMDTNDVNKNLKQNDRFIARYGYY